MGLMRAVHGKWLPARIAFVESEAISLALKRRRAVEHTAMRTDAAIRPNARFYIGVSGYFIVEMSGGKD
jgi:hypothetical protein